MPALSIVVTTLATLFVVSRLVKYRSDKQVRKALSISDVLCKNAHLLVFLTESSRFTGIARHCHPFNSSRRTSSDVLLEPWLRMAVVLEEQRYVPRNIQLAGRTLILRVSSISTHGRGDHLNHRMVIR